MLDGRYGGVKRVEHVVGRRGEFVVIENDIEHQGRFGDVVDDVVPSWRRNDRGWLIGLFWLEGPTKSREKLRQGSRRRR